MAVKPNHLVLLFDHPFISCWDFISLVINANINIACVGKDTQHNLTVSQSIEQLIMAEGMFLSVHVRTDDEWLICQSDHIFVTAEVVTIRWLDLTQFKL